TAPLELFFPYARTVGPTLSRFFTGLREQRIEGLRGVDGRVLVPPAEFDPLTGEALSEWVELAPVGSVVTWSWQPHPVEGNVLQQPFAWALIKLDGADVPLLHGVDAGDAAAMSTGMRVQARWAAERVGSITDIECFEPVGAGAGGAGDGPSSAGAS
ncbi:MAG TPA: OB-fold domain-containing protein, partial [Ilumatobacteraceae bacterium]